MAMPASQRQPAYIPSVRARNLAARLKEFREAAGLSQANAAAMLNWSTAKVGHIETCRNKVSVEDAELLLNLYGVVGPERDGILALASEADRRSWWTEYVDVLHGPYVALEDAADRIRAWSPQIIHGLLQTPDYAREIISIGRGSPEDIERRLQARMLRQAVLSRPDHPHLHLILDEAALERPIGGREVMRAQLRKLSMEAERPNITIQILPKATGTHPGLDGGMIVLEFAEPTSPDVGYCEGIFGATILEGPRAVAGCNVVFERLSKAALSPQESVALIDAAATR